MPIKNIQCQNNFQLPDFRNYGPTKNHQKSLSNFVVSKMALIKIYISKISKMCFFVSNFLIITNFHNFQSPPYFWPKLAFVRFEILPAKQISNQNVDFLKNPCFPIWQNANDRRCQTNKSSGHVVVIL